MATTLHERRGEPTPRRALRARLHDDEEWDWVSLVEDHRLGWVTARYGQDLVGFANVLIDGFVHAWLQDVMVSPDISAGGRIAAHRRGYEPEPASGL
jgi:hypothetical protein